MRKLRAAVIGAGNIAQSEHLPAYQMISDLVEVVAIADIQPQRSIEAAKRFGIPSAYGSAQEMLEKESAIDFVDVCTWNQSHAELSIQAMEKGCAVICEKPLAIDLPSAERIAAAVGRTGVPFMVAMVSRFGSEAQLLKSMIDQGELGEVYFSKTGYLRRRGTPIGWFTDRSKSGGGALIDIGVHNLDLTWWLMGCPKPVRVTGRTASYIGNFTTKGVTRWEALDKGNGVFDTEDSISGMISFDNGSSLFLEASWAINGPGGEYTQLFGTKAGATLQPLTIYGENAQEYLVDVSPQTQKVNKFAQELKHLIHCIHTGETPISPVSHGVSVQRMIHGLYESARLNREMVLE